MRGTFVLLFSHTHFLFPSSEFELFRSIEPKECLKQKWNKDKEQAPNITVSEHKITPRSDCVSSRVNSRPHVLFDILFGAFFPPSLFQACIRRFNHIAYVVVTQIVSVFSL